MDRKPLTFILFSTQKKLSGCQVQQLLLTAEYVTMIKHVAGSNNTVGNVLSQIDAIITPGTYNSFMTLKKHQDEDFDLADALHKVNKCGRYFVPCELQHYSFYTIHGLNHPSKFFTIINIKQMVCVTIYGQRYKTMLWSVYTLPTE